MRVKLQLVMCSDDGHEETVTDLVTLKKDSQRIEHLGLSLKEAKQLLTHDPETPAAPPSGRVSRRVRDLHGLRRPPQGQRLSYPVVPYLVRHFQARPARVCSTAAVGVARRRRSPAVRSPSRVSRPRCAWRRSGAHLLLQTRVKTLNHELGAVFKRWYPDMEVEELSDAA